MEYTYSLNVRSLKVNKTNSISLSISVYYFYLQNNTLSACIVYTNYFATMSNK